MKPVTSVFSIRRNQTFHGTHAFEPRILRILSTRSRGLFLDDHSLDDSTHSSENAKDEPPPDPRPTRARGRVCRSLSIEYQYYYAERYMYMYCWKHSTFISPQKQSASFREDLPCRTPPSFHIKNIPVRRTVDLVDQVTNQPISAWHGINQVTHHQSTRWCNSCWSSSPACRTFWIAR